MEQGEIRVNEAKKLRDEIVREQIELRHRWRGQEWNRKNLNIVLRENRLN